MPNLGGVFAGKMRISMSCLVCQILEKIGHGTFEINFWILKKSAQKKTRDVSYKLGAEYPFAQYNGFYEGPEIEKSEKNIKIKYMSQNLLYVHF